MAHVKFCVAPPESTARVGLWPAGLVALLTLLPAAAQDAPGRVDAADGLLVLAAEGRNLVVLPPYGAAPPGLAAPPAFGGLTARSLETASQRIHVVSLGGDTYRAATPLDGPWSRIAFDPGRRNFARLLPSIRVELNANVRLYEVEAALGAVRVTVFESLRFAIVDLPEDLHPAEAVERVRALPGQPDAAVRLMRPGIEWK